MTVAVESAGSARRRDRRAEADRSYLEADT